MSQEGDGTLCVGSTRLLAVCVPGAAHRSLCGWDVRPGPYAALQAVRQQKAQGLQPLTWCCEEQDSLRQMAALPEWASKGQTSSRGEARWTILDSAVCWLLGLDLHREPPL